jgi:hypothetical protein
MADGRCPSCQGDTARADPAKTNKALLDIRALDANRLPEICMMCGGTTDEVTVVVRSRQDEQASEEKARWWLLLLLRPTDTLIKYVFGGRERVQVTVPIHRTCFLEKEPVPESVNFERSSMRFVVHQNLKTAYK